MIAATWWSLLKAYRDLSTARFRVIVAMEEGLPARIYSEEWEHLTSQAGPWRAHYRGLNRIERIVPLVFAAISTAELIRQIS